MEEYLEIMQKSKQLFMRYGVKTITMDDLSREMGISKKTLYKYFTDKAELIKKVIEEHQNEDICFVTGLRGQAKDAVQELVLISEHVVQMFQNLNPTFLYDLEKYYKDSWEVINDYHRTHIAQSVRENLQRGQSEGLYRRDIDIEVISRLYIGMIHACTDIQFFPYPPFHPVNTYPKVIEYHIHAVTTPKGLELYNKYMKEN